MSGNILWSASIGYESYLDSRETLGSKIFVDNAFERGLTIYVENEVVEQQLK